MNKKTVNNTKAKEIIEKAVEEGIKVEGEIIEHGDKKALRTDKTGKGRYDLIPKEMVTKVLKLFAIDQDIDTYAFTHNYILNSAFNRDYAATILGMIAMYGIENVNDIDVKDISRVQLRKNFVNMLQDLAIHYEKGAKVYGENNWKGLDKRSFTESGLRHMLQWLNGETDENHYISAIWNYACAIWCISKED